MAKLPILGDMDTANLVTAYAAERLLKPFRKAAGDAQSLPDTIAQLVGIKAISVLTNPLVKMLSSNDSSGKAAQGRVKDARSTNASPSENLKKVFEDGFTLLNNSFDKMHKTLEELLFITDSSMTKAAQGRVKDAREKFLQMESEKEAFDREQRQIELLEEISKKDEGEKEGGILDKIMKLFQGWIILEGVSKLTGILAGTLGVLHKAVMGLPLQIGGLGRTMLKMLGPAIAAFNAYQAYEMSDDYAKEIGTKSSFLGADTSSFTAGAGLLLGGKGEGVGNIAGSAVSGALTGGSIGTLVGGPVGTLVGTVLGALIGGISGYLGGERIAKALDDVINTLSDAMLNAYEGFSKGLDKIWEWVLSVKDFLTDIGKKIISGFSFLKDGAVYLYDSFVDAVQWVRDFSFIDAISEGFTAIKSSVGTFFTSIKEGFLSYIYDFLKELGPVGERIIDNVLPDSFIQKKQSEETTDSSETLSPMKKNNSDDELVPLKIMKMIEVPSFGLPKVETVKNKGKEILTDFNQTIKDSFDTLKEEMKKQNEMKQAPQRASVMPVTVQSPPVIVNAPSSSPMLISPKPMRNPNYGNPSGTKFLS